MKTTPFPTPQHHRFKRFTRKAYATFASMHKVVSIGVVAGYMLTFAPTTHAAAPHLPAAAPDTTEREHTLDELVITSSRTGIPLQQAAKPVTLITRADIERQPVHTLSDLLKNVAGIDVRQRGPHGVQTDLSLRGGTFDQVAILLNGINLTNPQTGHYSMDLPVNLSDIDHIEIIQGPTALLYGAGAFAGGIHIVTKTDTTHRLQMQVDAGMHALRGAEIRGALSSGTTSHSLSAGYKASSGYRPDSDYEIINLLWQSHFQEENARLDLQFGLNDKAYGANTFYSPSYENQFDDTQTLFAALQGSAGTTLKFIPQLYATRHYDTFHLFRDGTPDRPDWYQGPNHHYTDVFGLHLHLQYRWIGGTTSAGGEIRNEGIFSNTLGRDTVRLGRYTVRDQRTNVSYFLEHTYLRAGLTLSLGLLANYNTAFSHRIALYPNLHAAYWLSDRLKIFASWNNAVRMPTFTDLYYAAPDLQGFADLQPEASESYEAGLRYHLPAATFTLHTFYEKGKNLIDWIRNTPEDPIYHATNLTTVDKLGFETTLTLPLNTLLPPLTNTQLQLTYLYLHQTRDAGPWISNYVMDYLKHKFTAGLTHPIAPHLQANWQFRLQDRAGTYTRYEHRQPIGEEPYPPFALLDLKLTWNQGPLTLFLTATNLFNTPYYDRGNLPQPGFWCIGGLGWRIR
jgi:iron complex outermembrane receptor protein